MGMFDKPQYLTGPMESDPFAQPGDTFWLHNAKLDGTVQIGGKVKDQAKLLVSREQNGERVSVFTAGAGIVNQVRRMSADDRSNLPMEVRLDQVPSKQGNPTNVLSLASDPVPEETTESEGDF